MPNFSPAVNANTDPGKIFSSIAPSDTVGLPFTARGIYVGTTGDITAVNENNVAVLFKAVPAGIVLPIMAIRVNATATTATNLVALF